MVLEAVAVEGDPSPRARDPRPGQANTSRSIRETTRQVLMIVRHRHRVMKSRFETTFDSVY